MTANTLAIAPDARSAGPRGGRSWARRHPLASAVLALVAFTLVVRLTWGWYCARQLAAELDNLRAPDQPTLIDPAPPSPPESNDAWAVYAKAVAAVNRRIDAPRASGLVYPPYPPHGPDWLAQAAAAEAANAAALAIARTARPLETARYVPGDEFGVRVLANALADGAQYAHARGDDAEAVERILDVLHLARSVRQAPDPAAQWFALEIQSVGLDAAQQVVPTLRLDASAGGAPATIEQAKALVAATLDEAGPREWMIRALHAARAATLADWDAAPRRAWTLRPLADRTMVRWLREFEALVRAAEQNHAGGARRLVGALESRRSRDAAASNVFGSNPLRHQAPRYSRWFEHGRPATMARGLEQYFRTSAERRLTAVVVAARLYRHEHGRWPAVATDLVQKYLDAVPPDPFREDGGPVGYTLLRAALPGGGDRPVVYFEAGEDREDLIQPEPMYGWQQDPRHKTGQLRRDIRQYRDVSLWTPATGGGGNP